jgi:hypothetical protein
MNKCPECKRYSLEYFSAAEVASCLFCGHSEKIATRDDFYLRFPNGRTVSPRSENPEGGISSTRPSLA